MRKSNVIDVSDGWRPLLYSALKKSENPIKDAVKETQFFVDQAHFKILYRLYLGMDVLRMGTRSYSSEHARRNICLTKGSL